MELPTVHNMYRHSESGEREVIYPLLEKDSFRLEKIVSYGQVTPAGQWYDQDREEWVLLLKGTAVIRFDPGGCVTLAEGDFLTIPAHHKHRVESCSFDAVWLALHYVVKAA